MPYFAVGKEIVPLFAACGQMQEILYDDKRLFVLVGNEQKAEDIVAVINNQILNAHQEGWNTGYKAATAATDPSFE